VLGWINMVCLVVTQRCGIHKYWDNIKKDRIIYSTAWLKMSTVNFYHSSIFWIVHLCNYFKIMATKLWKIRKSAWEVCSLWRLTFFLMHRNIFTFAQYVTRDVSACYLVNTALTFSRLKKSFAIILAFYLGVQSMELPFQCACRPWHC